MTSMRECVECVDCDNAARNGEVCDKHRVVVEDYTRKRHAFLQTLSPEEYRRYMHEMHDFAKRPAFLASLTPHQVDLYWRQRNA
jgi:hypothetical protein